MVRKPKRRKQEHPSQRRQRTLLYIISILVVLSMAIGLAVSFASRGPSSSLAPLSALLLLTL